MTDNDPTVTTRTRKWGRWQNITHIELGPDGVPLTITGTREADGEWHWADEDTSNQEDGSCTSAVAFSSWFSSSS